MRQHTSVAGDERLKGAKESVSEAKLDVIVKAINLMEYTMTITSNRKRYPVKHLTLVKRIQNRCMDIYEYLLDANRLKLDTSKIRTPGIANKSNFML